MGVFDGLLNMFKNSNTATFTEPAAIHQIGSTVGYPSYRKAPLYRSVRPQAQSPSKLTAASFNTGAAKWFNGIGTASVSKQTNSLTVYSLKGKTLHLTASDYKASGGEGTVYAIPGKPNISTTCFRILQSVPKSRNESMTCLPSARISIRLLSPGLAPLSATTVDR